MFGSFIWRLSVSVEDEAIEEALSGEHGALHLMVVCLNELCD